MPIRPPLASASYLRNFVFGVEDSLVSTVGLLSGIAIAGVERHAILVTGVVLICVEAFSMAVGSFLAEHAAEDYLAGAEVPIRQSSLDGIIMFASYFFSGFIPLAPYFLLTSARAFWWSVGLSLSALFVLGVIGAKFSRLNLFTNGLRMLLVGGIAIAVGIAAGRFFNLAV